MTLKVGCAGVLALATVFLANSTRAGDRVNVRAMGMARSSAAISRGLDAVGTNPANLALPGDDVMTFTVLPFGVLVGSDFLTYDLFTMISLQSTSPVVTHSPAFPQATNNKSCKHSKLRWAARAPRQSRDYLE